MEPVEAETVRAIFTRYADGLGMAAIAARLNARAIPSPRQAKGHRTRLDSIGAGWDLSAVRGILGNEQPLGYERVMAMSGNPLIS